MTGRPAPPAPTCESWLLVVRPHLPKTLVDARAWGFLRTLGRYLPGEGMYVLEVRLADAARRVDLALGLDSPESAQSLLPHLSPEHLRAVLQAWPRNIRARESVLSLWLEFDYADALEELPAPVVCAKLKDRTATAWGVTSLLTELHGRKLSPDQRDLVQACLEAAPADARLLYVFSLLSRPGRDVRLELYGISPAETLSYLERLGRPELQRQVRDLLPVIGDCDRHLLSLDLGDRISTRIGIEAAFRRLPHREPRWGLLFDRLVVAGLCSKEKRDAVFAWPGYDQRASRPRQWPATGAELNGHCVRCLSHVKWVTWPDRPPEAKVYLLFRYLARKGKSREPIG